MIGLLLGNWQRFLAYGAVALLALSLAELDGYRRGERKLWDYQTEQAKAAVPIILKQGATTEKIIKQYRDRVRVIYEPARVIEKEIVRYVPPSADPVLPRGWVMLHDAAAVGKVPEAPGGTDVAAPAIAASQAIRGVSDNYATCHGTELQLVTLQAWLRMQYEVMNLEPLEY